MGKYIVKRLLWMVPVVVGVTVVIFTIMYFTPGDPASSGTRWDWTHPISYSSSAI